MITPGTRLGPYEVVGSLGAGGMGEVYRARETTLERTVSIKLLLAQGSNASLRDNFGTFERAEISLVSV